VSTTGWASASKACSRRSRTDRPHLTGRRRRSSRAIAGDAREVLLLLVRPATPVRAVGVAVASERAIAPRTLGRLHHTRTCARRGAGVSTRSLEDGGTSAGVTTSAPGASAAQSHRCHAAALPSLRGSG
jgi:hypothetical protein